MPLFARPTLAFAFALLMLISTACGGSRAADPGQPITVEEPLETPTSEVLEEPNAVDPEDEPDLVVSEDACETDADCVPAACCHAAACVGRANAPDCNDSMCTMECRYGTLDCGGGCLCHEGRCAARLSEAPTMLPAE